jgi:GT2 family glycosyltransferase
MRKVTVVIATRNRRTSLGRTLRALDTDPIPPGVIVVDNGSWTVRRTWSPCVFRRSVSMVLDRNAGAVARNFGVAVASTPYVAFADDELVMGARRFDASRPAPGRRAAACTARGPHTRRRG